MNNIENEFLEIKQKQVSTLFSVCNYLSGCLNINDFYLYSQGYYITPEIYADEVVVDDIEQIEIKTIYNCYGHIDEKVKELKYVIKELIHLLNTMIESDSPGLYFSKNNSFEEFSKQFKDI